MSAKKNCFQSAKSAKSVKIAKLPMSVNLLHKTTKSVKSLSAALTAREKGDGRREMADVRKESEETGEGHIQRRYRYILIEALAPPSSSIETFFPCLYN